jgi:hypothetical protein
MEVSKLIVDLIGKIIWPILTFAIVWKFRKPIATRLKDINEIELPGGFKAKLEKLDQVIEAKIEESIDKVENPIVHQTETTKAQGVSIETNDGENTMLVFTANRTQKENLKYDIYYDPVTRSHNIPFKYIGLYADKNIFAIGKVSKVVACDYEDGKLVKTGEYDLKLLTGDEYDRIKLIIENTPYYDIKHGIKFFLVDKFYEIDFAKVSDYPIRAKKYFWLDEIEGFRPGMSTIEIAKLIDGKEWE